MKLLYTFASFLDGHSFSYSVHMSPVQIHLQNIVIDSDEEWQLYRDALRWIFFPNLDFRVHLEKIYDFRRIFSR